MAFEGGKCSTPPFSALVEFRSAGFVTTHVPSQNDSLVILDMQTAVFQQPFAAIPAPQACNWDHLKKHERDSACDRIKAMERGQDEHEQRCIQEREA